MKEKREDCCKHWTWGGHEANMWLCRYKEQIHGGSGWKLACAKAQCNRDGFGLLRYVIITVVPLPIECGFLKLPNKAISVKSWWILTKQSLPLNSMTFKTYIYHFRSSKMSQKPSKHRTLMVFSELGRQRPQKRKDSGLVRIWGTSTHGGGVTNLGTLWKWIFPELWWFLENFTVVYSSHYWSLKAGDGNRLLNYLKRQLT